jgi:hypothetical protein
VKLRSEFPSKRPESNYGYREHYQRLLEKFLQHDISQITKSLSLWLGSLVASQIYNIARRLQISVALYRSFVTA